MPVCRRQKREDLDSSGELDCMFQKEKDKQPKHKAREEERKEEEEKEQGRRRKGEGITLQVLGIMLKNSCHLLSAIYLRKLPSHWSRFLSAPHPHPESA